MKCLFYFKNWPHYRAYFCKISTLKKKKKNWGKAFITLALLNQNVFIFFLPNFIFLNYKLYTRGLYGHTVCLLGLKNILNLKGRNQTSNLKHWKHWKSFITSILPCWLFYMPSLPPFSHSLWCHQAHADTTPIVLEDFQQHHPEAGPLTSHSLPNSWNQRKSVLEGHSMSDLLKKLR